MSVSVDQVRNEISRLMRPADDSAFAWVREMFVDRAILEIEEPGQEIRLVEVTWQLEGDDLENLEVGDPREVTLEYVAKAEGGPRLAGPIVRKDAAKRIAYSAVLVPGEPDSDGEVLTAEKVEDVAHTWLEQFRAFDIQHSVKQIEAAPVESYIEPADRTVQIDGEDVVLPAGTWTLAVKMDEDAWAEVQEGTRTGLSIMGVPNDQLEAALSAVKSGTAPAMKRVTLADVGGGDPNGDWFAPFIGIVDQPAVPKAKFYAFKAAPKPAGLGRRLADALRGTPAAKEGRRFSDQTYRKLVELTEAATSLLEEAESERADKAHDHKEHDVDRDEVQQIVSEAVPGAVKSAIGDALSEHLTPISERLDALDGGGEGDGAGDGAANKNDGEDGDELSDAVKEAISAAVSEAVTPIAEKADRAERRSRPGSRQVDDDPDAPAAVKEGPIRDPFGRRIDA